MQDKTKEELIDELKDVHKMLYYLCDCINNNTTISNDDKLFRQIYEWYSSSKHERSFIS